MVCTRILSAYIDNTLTTGSIVLVISIIVSYDIDFARCIAEEIPECTLRRSTLIPFPCLVHGLCNWGADIMLNVDVLIDVHKTQGASLITVDENLIAQR